ncbi:DUF5009 domain-containing protein [Lutibacter sp. A80]|uniref:DUF5009 domain-containing protein n=1 Tax=Lutibacter sp. A80 TaxID=2918453 RepID=UPI001F0681A1|nr:DUF5009 domain-containing protein [Lutibacter sp. A80]UMB61045.1 DUF5009 domain-containing protein [Lutibacter sp. A80]
MKLQRIASIDVLRAITMFLMLWVNDFPTLTNVPKWLKHASYNEDYLGFSDVIFPLFLFIVGLSIPLAIEYRNKIGKSLSSTVKHIAIRSVSLIIIGVFMVNYESAHSEHMLIDKYFWCLLMAIAVCLIWMNWSKSPVHPKWHKFIKAFGILILIFLAIIYIGGPEGEMWMKTQWWGILGLIGWAYLVNAYAYLFANKKLKLMAVVLLIFMALQLLHQLDYLPRLNSNLSILNTIYNGTIPAFTTSGILATLLYKKLSNKSELVIFLVFSSITIIFICYGLITKPFWGISKLQGTPAWSGICIGIGFFSFTILHFIVDFKKKIKWAKIIEPAGTATLTCYLIPYFIYPLINITGFRFPDFLNSGSIGLFISLIYALLVILFTGFLAKKGFKLKL